MNGKEIRLHRISQNGRFLSVPLDHGVTNSELDKLIDFQEIVLSATKNGATSIIVHKGMVRNIPTLNHSGLIIHLSASTEMYNEVNKTIVCSVPEAIAYGADAVSVHVNIGNSFEQSMLKSFSAVAGECARFEIPLLAMIYVRNDRNEDIHNKNNLSHAVRIATELGADIIKIPLLNNYDDLAQIIKSSSLPIVFAGGKRCETDTQVIEKARHIMRIGAAGISFGRNIFESNNPSRLISELRDVVLYS